MFMSKLGNGQPLLMYSVCYVKKTEGYTQKQIMRIRTIFTWGGRLVLRREVPGFKDSFAFPQITPNITQAHTLYTSLSFYIIFTIFHNIRYE